MLTSISKDSIIASVKKAQKSYEAWCKTSGAKELFKTRVEEDKLAKRRKKDLLVNLSGLDTKYLGKDSVWPTKLFNNQKKLIELLDSFCCTGTNKKGGWQLPYIYGPAGTGKTFLSCLFVSRVIHYGVGNKTAFFIRASDIMYHHLESDNKSSYNLRRAKTADVLVIDDIGAHFRTDYGLGLIQSILDTRIDNMKSTIITSNIPINEIKSKFKKGTDGRTSEFLCSSLEDRMFELCTIFNLTGDSVRLKIAQKIN